jgi:hypothetical protein|tara:strand:+ start:20596 stop:21258 length:663 start_codon:yes stop_codon:yes gene_type:complete
MFLFTEQNFDTVQHIVEASKETGEKSYFIEGVFMQADIKNRNGRVYPGSVMEQEVDRYNREYVKTNRAYGELGHPDGPSINLERVSHMIKSLKKEGNDYVGRAKIMDTPYGKIVKSLIDEGAQLGVSSRGMGTIKMNHQGINEVQGDFMLATAGDIVADPSAPNAFVNGVMEGVEWVKDAASGSWKAQQVIEQIQDMGKKSNKQLQEHKVAAFAKFLNSL